MQLLATNTSEIWDISEVISYFFNIINFGMTVLEALYRKEIYELINLIYKLPCPHKTIW